MEEIKIKYVVRIKETLTTTVVVEACNYEEAEMKVRKDHIDEKIVLNAYNSHVEVEYADITNKVNHLPRFVREEYSYNNQKYVDFYVD